MRRCLQLPWVSSIGAVYSSAERKAQDAAAHLAAHLALPVQRLSGLGENDRSSTGYLASQEFEQVASAFFAAPHESVRGWERAIDAQVRIFGAASEVAAAAGSLAAVAIVSHGAVGTLLYCHLTRRKIDRQFDQPPNGGGNYFSYSMSPPKAHSWWRAIDESVI